MAVDEQILARDLVAMSDEELDNYLHAKRGRGAKGVGLVETSAIIIDIPDPENLPPSFIERLRDRAESSAPSRPIDLNEVANRLQNLIDTASQSRLSTPEAFSANCSSSKDFQLGSAANGRKRRREASTNPDKSSGITGLSRTPSRSPSVAVTEPPESPGAYLRNVMRSEEESHDKLVQDGCPPWYPISDIARVIDEPATYDDRIWVWQDDRRDSIIFAKQMAAWNTFRGWQNDRRLDKSPAEIMADVERNTMKRLQKRRVSLESRCIHIDELPRSQEPLSTWVEYLDYLSCLSDAARSGVGPLRSRYETRCKQLRDSGLLRPEVTEEDLLAERGAVARALSGASADMSVTTNAGALEAFHDENSDPVTRKERDRLISNFFVSHDNLHDAERKLRRYNTMWDWALEQLPNIRKQASKTNSRTLKSCPPPKQRRGRRKLDDEVVESNNVNDNTFTTDTGQPPPKRSPRISTLHSVTASKEQNEENEKNNAGQAKARAVESRHSTKTMNMTTAKRRRKGAVARKQKGHAPASTISTQSIAARPLRRSARIAAINARKNDVGR